MGRNRMYTRVNHRPVLIRMLHRWHLLLKNMCKTATANVKLFLTLRIDSVSLLKLILLCLRIRLRFTKEQELFPFFSIQSRLNSDNFLSLLTNLLINLYLHNIFSIQTAYSKTMNKHSKFSIYTKVVQLTHSNST